MTWSEFNDSVRAFLVTHNRRQGIQDLIDKYIRAGALDMQRSVPYYQTGNVDTYAVGDVVTEGYASRIDAPAGHVTRVHMVKYDSEEVPCEYCDLTEVDNLRVPDMICGLAREGDHWVSFSRQYVYVTPSVDSTCRLKVTWDGCKVDYADDDEVPFDEDVAHAVADYVSARLARTVDHDLQEAASFDMTYRKLKTEIFSDRRQRSQLKSTASIP